MTNEALAPAPAGQQHATGTFDIKVTPLPASESGGGLGRLAIEKQYHGDLEGRGAGEMLTSGPPPGPNGSGGYVAIERVTGTLNGRSGSFVLQHSGTATRGKTTLSVTVVPDSGTGELAGLAGSMTIKMEAGKHSYDLAYSLQP